MVRCHRRIGFLRPKQELEKLRPACAVLVAMCSEYPIHSDACRCAGEATKAIDACLAFSCPGARRSG
jgi:hypothetical protein